MIENVADLIRELRKLPSYMPVRDCFDGGGSYYFPHVKLRRARDSETGQPVMVISGEREEFSEIRGTVDMHHPDDKTVEDLEYEASMEKLCPKAETLD